MVFLILGLFWAAPPPVEDGFVILAHPDVKVEGLSQVELKQIFRGRKKFWPGGDRIILVVQPFHNPISRLFFDEVLNKESASMSRYYLKQALAGKGVRPVEKQNDQAVLEYIKDSPGAIGYVRKGADVAGYSLILIE